LPAQASAANKYLQSDGTNASWDAVSLSTADITGTLGVANGGTGITSFGTGVATFLGTPSSANLASAVTDETGTGALVFANTPTLVTPNLGTPGTLVGTNITGTATAFTASNVTTNANLTGDVTSVGNATTLTNAPVIAKVLTGYVSGAGTVAATDSILQAIQKLNGNDATNANLTGAVTSVGNATSLGSFTSSQLATALTDETGSGANVFATSPTLVTPDLGTPSALVGTNITGTAANFNINGTVGATTANTGAFTTLSASGTTTLSGNQIISVTDNTNAALRITQLGTGNAILVEDSTNPDSTPFVVDANGRVVSGTSSALTVTAGVASRIQSVDTDASSGFAALRYSADANSSNFVFSKSRSSTIGTNTIVSANDETGKVIFAGNDGSGFVQSATITSAVDGTPGTNDMPGRLLFSTTADGASSPTERMRIDSAGRVGIGPSGTSSNATIFITKNITGSTVLWNTYTAGTVQSDVTSQAKMYVSSPSTAASAFTLSTLGGFTASQNTIGAGSTVTNQYGFEATSSLTGATNNYGFYGDIASGTGRFNLYMNGTANNYMAGKLGIGGAPTTAVSSLEITKAVTGATTMYGVANYATVQSDVTTAANYYWTQGATQASAFTLTNLRHFYASQGTIGASSTVTNQVGFNVDSSLTGATNNYAFRGLIASGTGRYNVYMDGTADNYLSGSTGVGTTSMTGKFNVSGSSGGISAYFTDAVNSSLAVRNASGGVILGTDGSGAIHLATNGNTTAERRLTIDSTGNVGIGTTGPNASALLDVQSTTKGVRMPNMTTTQKNAISSPAAGLMVFDTTLAKLCVYSGSAWQTITSV
jgi:hypothetical protein